ncbi:MAG: HAD-IA family hydrolase [Micromonosporaceae bacterium]|nr:HAD-IA family hydrolase [Micromonosporaceae bacterium]
MVQAVLYDLDGVILDSRDLVATTLTSVAASALGDAPDAEAVGRVLSLPPVEALAALGVPDAAQAFDDGFDAAYAIHAHQARLVPGVVSGMRRLRAAGLRLGLVTLQRRHRLAMLPLQEVLDLFDVTVAFEDAAPKPAPDGVLGALGLLGVPPAQAWFIGDSPTDIAAGRAAGVTAAGASWGYYAAETLWEAWADPILYDPGQITTILLPDGDTVCATIAAHTVSPHAT